MATDIPVGLSGTTVPCRKWNFRRNGERQCPTSKLLTASNIPRDTRRLVEVAGTAKRISKGPSSSARRPNVVESRNYVSQPDQRNNVLINRFETSNFGLWPQGFTPHRIDSSVRKSSTPERPYARTETNSSKARRKRSKIRVLRLLICQTGASRNTNAPEASHFRGTDL